MRRITEITTRKREIKALRLSTMNISILAVYFMIVKCTNSTPVLAMGPGPYLPMGYGLYESNPTQPRIFWNAIINQIDWLPIEVNVPDVVNSIISSIPSNVGNTLQRIPLLDRLTNPVRPRPLSYVLLVPVQMLPNAQSATFNHHLENINIQN